MVKKTWNQQLVKIENKTLVLEAIKEKAPISRAEIAQLTGLNKGTVSSLVGELLDSQIINESGPGQSSGGRRPVILNFNRVAGYTIGIDLGVNYLLGVLTDLEGNIVSEEYIEFNELTYEEIIHLLFSVINKLIKVVPDSPYGLIGIGVGVPGIVERSNKILLAPNLEWRNVKLKDILENHFHIPVVIENEANAGANGEKKFGIGKNNNHIIYVSVGIGIGVGLILNGKLYRGNNGFSGEFGHMTIKADGKKCSCGNEGCWELYASEKALLRESKYLELEIPEMNLENLIKLARNNNPSIIKLFEKIGEYLGIGINNIINIFNPEQIIIGNRMAIAEPWLKPQINNWIKNHSLWFSQREVQIDFSRLPKHSTALGAAAFAVDEFLKRKILV
jgi:glucokinase-like ROK family protein